MRFCSPWLPVVVYSESSRGVGSTDQPQPAALSSSQMVWPAARPSVVPPRSAMRVSIFRKAETFSPARAQRRTASFSSGRTCRAASARTLLLCPSAAADSSWLSGRPSARIAPPAGTADGLKVSDSVPPRPTYTRPPQIAGPLVTPVSVARIETVDLSGQVADDQRPVGHQRAGREADREGAGYGQVGLPQFLAVAVHGVDSTGGIGRVDDVVDDGWRSGDGAGRLEPPHHAKFADIVRAQPGFSAVVPASLGVVVVHRPVLRVARNDIGAAGHAAVFAQFHRQADLWSASSGGTRAALVKQRRELHGPSPWRAHPIALRSHCAYAMRASASAALIALPLWASTWFWNATS